MKKVFLENFRNIYKWVYFNMIMLKGKRGASDNPWGTIVVISITLGVLFVVGLFIWGAYSKGQDIIDIASPEELDEINLRCKTFYNPSFKESFCSFKSLKLSNGDEGYVNCQHDKIVERLHNEGVVGGDDLDEAKEEIENFCGDSSKKLAKEKCQELMESDDGLDEVWVNGFEFGEGCGVRDPDEDSELEQFES